MKKTFAYMFPNIIPTLRQEIRNNEQIAKKANASGANRLLGQRNAEIRAAIDVLRGLPARTEEDWHSIAIAGGGE